RLWPASNCSSAGTSTCIALPRNNRRRHELFISCHACKDQTMSQPLFTIDRRHFLRGLGAASLALYTPGAFAEELTRTPPQTEGPFYPDRLPLDTDNDLLVINDAITPAVGEVTHFS